MSRPLLVIGNRNYSSWSLRGWLALRHCGVDFDTHRIALDTPEFAAEVRRYSRAGRVPVLVVGEQSIWDSLAIAEYAADTGGRGWPGDPLTRALARAATCEMHSGFAALRQRWPMNLRARGRAVPLDAAAAADLARIEALWSELRARFAAAGPWLLGEYSIADAFYAPIACRLATYARRELAPLAEAYARSALTDPELLAWSAAAALETEVLEQEEVGGA